MSNYIFSRNERFYIQPQTVFGTIPNSSGTATLAGSNAVRGIKWDMQGDIATLTRRDKTGTRSATQGVAGRGMAKWSIESSLVTSGVVGTKPSLDPFWLSLFGAGAVIGGGTPTGYGYTLLDPLSYFCMWSFRTSSAGVATGVDERCVFGCIPTQATFNLGQDVAEFTAEGEAKWQLRSNGFSSMTTDEKGGLTAFPVEPASPVYTDGGLIAGFTGSITMNSQVISSNLVNAQIMFRTGAEVVKNTFGAYTPNTAEADERNVSTTFGLYDDDGTALEGIKEASESKTPLTIIYQIGTVPGNIITFTLQNVLIGAFDTDNSSQRRAVLNFGESRAFGTSPTALNEIGVVFS